MLLDFARQSQIGFQDPATPLAEGIVDLHNTIFFWLIIIFTPVVIIFFRIIKRSQITWDNPTKISLFQYRKESLVFNRIIHGTLLEIIWTITPTIILIAIAIPSFGLIYAMDSINDPDWTVKVIGNQWFWTYDFNFGAMLMTDIQEIYLAFLKRKSSSFPSSDVFFSEVFMKDVRAKIKAGIYPVGSLTWPRSKQFDINLVADLAHYRNQNFVNNLLHHNQNLVNNLANFNLDYNRKILNLLLEAVLTNTDVKNDIILVNAKAVLANTNVKNDLIIEKAKAAASRPGMEKMVVEKTIKLWKHNVKNYLIDSYTLTENTENRNVRLLSTDNPLYVPVHKNIRVF